MFSAAAVLAVVGSALAFSPSDVVFCNDGNTTHGCQVRTAFLTLQDQGLGSQQLRCAASPTTTLCPIITIYNSN